MRRRGDAVPAVLSALVVRMTLIPASPHPQSHTTLHLRTFAPVVDRTKPCGFRLVPYRVSYPFRVEAIAPGGTRRAVRVRQVQGNLYAGTVRVARRGLWKVRVLNFVTAHQRVDPCSGAVLRFRVR